MARALQRLGLWVALSVAALEGTAQANGAGVAGHSGRTGAICTQCHYAYNRNLRVSVELLNQDLTPAVQPVSPLNIYTFRLTQTYATPVGFKGGFNLVVGDANGTSGTMLVHAGQEGATQILGGEATHASEQTSTNVSGTHKLEWLVDWYPPAIGDPGGPATPVRVFAAATKSNAVVTATEVRALSAVSNTPNAMGAPECGPATVAGFDPSVCGVEVTVAPADCLDLDGDGYLPVECVFEVDRGGGDCDDNVETTYPDAPELCNFADDDCDFDTDEGFVFQGVALGEACDDADADKCANGTVECSGDGLAAVCFETVNVSEICGNDIDDDCDGTKDETTGLTWEGKPFGETCDSAGDDDLCQFGRVGCEANLPACVNDQATPEFCGNNRDDDCDGTNDEQPCLGIPDSGIPMPDAGPPPPPDAAGQDSAVADAALPDPPDAAMAPDAAPDAAVAIPDAGAPASPPPEEEPPLCDCSSVPTGTAWLGMAAIGMVVPLSRRRRR